MKSLLTAWQFWAAMSAVFAALTAIFGKIGVQEHQFRFRHFDPNGHYPRGCRPYRAGKWNLAAAVRDKPQDLSLFAAVWHGHGRLLALLLPCPEIGTCIRGRTHRQDERHSGGAVCRRLPGRAFEVVQLAWHRSDRLGHDRGRGINRYWPAPSGRAWIPSLSEESGALTLTGAVDVLDATADAGALLQLITHTS